MTPRTPSSYKLCGLFAMESNSCDWKAMWPKSEPFGTRPTLPTLRFALSWDALLLSGEVPLTGHLHGSPGQHLQRTPGGRARPEPGALSPCKMKRCPRTGVFSPVYLL